MCVSYFTVKLGRKKVLVVTHVRDESACPGQAQLVGLDASFDKHLNFKLSSR